MNLNLLNLEEEKDLDLQWLNRSRGERGVSPLCCRRLFWLNEHNSASRWPSLLGFRERLGENARRNLGGCVSDWVCCTFAVRRGARAAEWAWLEIKCVLAGTQGSNPCLSAKAWFTSFSMRLNLCPIYLFLIYFLWLLAPRASGRIREARFRVVQ